MNRNKFKKYTHLWRLNTILFDQWINKSQRKLENFLRWVKNRTAYRNLMNTANSECKVIAVNASVKNQFPKFHLEKLEKEQTKCKVNRYNKIMKIRAQNNEDQRKNNRESQQDHTFVP